MSYQAVSWALYDAPHLYTDKGLPDTTARAVLCVLAEHADEHGANAHPSQLRIRYATGYDIRTIQRALDRLEAGQLIAEDGVVYSGTIRWKLSMNVTRPEGEWEGLQAEADETRRGESAKRKARRHRKVSIPGEDVRDAESRTSGTESPGHPGRKMPDVRDAEPPEPPSTTTLRTTPLTTTGDAPPPDPRGPEVPSGLRTEYSSLPASQEPHQDQLRNHLPRAREEEPHTRGRCKDHGLPVADCAPCHQEAIGAIVAYLTDSPPPDLTFNV